MSTGKQAEKDLSIPDQEKQLRAYCEKKGWEVYRVYTEDGASGRDDHRRVFKEMIAVARSKERPFDTILTLTTSRFFRNATQARVWKHELKKKGIRVIATHQETADDPMGMVVEGIFELMDQFESDMNGFHTLRAMKENARQGYYNGSQPRFGFKAVKADNAQRDE